MTPTYELASMALASLRAELRLMEQPSIDGTDPITGETIYGQVLASIEGFIEMHREMRMGQW